MSFITSVCVCVCVWFFELSLHVLKNEATFLDACFNIVVSERIENAT